MYINTINKQDCIESAISLDSFKMFCIENKEMNYIDDPITKEFINVSNEIESKFKNIDLLVYKKGAIENSIRESIPVKTAQNKKWQIDKHICSVMAEVKKIAKSIHYKPKGIESLYFIKEFDSTEEALKYARIKTVDGFMIKGTEKIIEDIVYRGYVENISLFMIYYIHYKFPLLFGEKVKFLYE